MSKLVWDDAGRKAERMADLMHMVKARIAENKRKKKS
jgi:hypothetical protein